MGNQFDRILLSIFYKDYLAPVVQWIEHWSPEPKIWVRLPAGVPFPLIDQILALV